MVQEWLAMAKGQLSHRTEDNTVGDIEVGEAALGPQIIKILDPRTRVAAAANAGPFIDRLAKGICEQERGSVRITLLKAYLQGLIGGVRSVFCRFTVE